MSKGSVTKNKALAYTQEIDGSPAVFVDGFIYEGFGLYLARYIYDAWLVSNRPVKLFISSDGGLLTEGTTFYDFIRAKGVAGSVEIYGKAGSTATVFGAAFGKENTSISENSEYFIHRARYMMQNDCGEYCHVDATVDTQAELDRTNAMLVNIYVQLTGKNADEINTLLDAGDKGNSISAQEAVSMGFCGSIIEPIASNIAAFKPINNTPAMAENNTPKVATKVKLNLGQALQALVGKEGTEYEIDVDAAISQQLADKDAEITALKGQIETLEAAKPAEVITPEQLAEVTAKADALTATVAAKELAIGEKAAEVVALKAQIAALKAPLATKTVADNQAAAVAAMPGTEAEDPNLKAIKAALKGTSASAKATQNKATA